MKINSRFSERIKRELLPQARFSGPTWYYDSHGDSIEFIIAPDSFRSERVDALVTVYYSHETGELVGSMIKGVKRICDKNPGLAAIDIVDGRVRLSLLFRASGWMHKSPFAMVYQKLIRAAEEANAEVELMGACD